MNQVTFLTFVATAVFCYADVPPQNPSLPTRLCTRKHEAAYPCGKQCEKQCGEELPGFCKGIQCEVFACRCQNGYERNTEANYCVLAKDCPVKKCPKGEIEDICGTVCEPTCANQNKPEICQLIDCNPNAVKKCRCHYEAGYVRDEKTKQCILIKNC